jgi:HK97 family phage portal protein
MAFPWFPWKKQETRTAAAADPSWAALQSLSPVGVATNARLAENLSTVLACVEAIGGNIAALPAFVFRRTEEGRELDHAHPIWRLIRNGPNRHQTWSDFLQWLVASTLLRGNGLAEIVTDERGAVTELVPVPWEHVSVQLLPSGRLAYDVSEITAIGGGTGRTKRLLDDEVMHLRDRSDDGLVGRSRLQRAASVVAQGLSLQDFAGSMWLNGINPSGIIEHPAHFKDAEDRERFREAFEKVYSGSRNAARALVLEFGMSWKQLSVSPEDAELLASRRFTVEEIARLYACPPPIVGDLSHGSFTNSETAGRWFAQFTLAGWIRKIEAEFARSVFSAASRATHELEIDFSGFLRGDPEVRWASHEIAVKNRILTPNEVRLVEGWNPREGGDEFDEIGATNA